MTKADFEALKRTVVRESFDGKPVWDGGVSLFALTGHPAATICYAWSAEVSGSTNQAFYAVLHLAPVESSRDAVRASLALRSREDTSTSRD